MDLLKTKCFILLLYFFFRPNFVIYYQQNDKDDYSILQKISYCFGLFWVPGHPPRNQYRGVIRFVNIVIYKYSATKVKQYNGYQCGLCSPLMSVVTCLIIWMWFDFVAYLQWLTDCMSKRIFLVYIFIILS